MATIKNMFFLFLKKKKCYLNTSENLRMLSVERRRLGVLTEVRSASRDNTRNLLHSQLFAADVCFGLFWNIYTEICHERTLVRKKKKTQARNSRQINSEVSTGFSQICHAGILLFYYGEVSQSLQHRLQRKPLSWIGQCSIYIQNTNQFHKFEIVHILHGCCVKICLELCGCYFYRPFSN